MKIVLFSEENASCSSHGLEIAAGCWRLRAGFFVHHHIHSLHRMPGLFWLKRVRFTREGGLRRLWQLSVDVFAIALAHDEPAEGFNRAIVSMVCDSTRFVASIQKASLSLRCFQNTVEKLSGRTVQAGSPHHEGGGTP